MDSMARADLHVHSWHSGYNHDLAFLRSRDCYADPLDVYRTAKARGMDLVTITDHDSIDGCIELLERVPDAADVIIGEEVSCRVPDTDLEVHFGVWGLTEAIHRDVQPLRTNAFEVAAFLRRAGVVFAFNHPLHFYRGQLPLETYLRLVDVSPAIETRNGAMLAAHNALAARFLGLWKTAGSMPRAAVGGSDAHTLRRVGRTWTEAPGRTREEFLASLAAGRSTVGGDEGGTLPLAADIYGVIAQYWLSLIGLRRNEISWPRRALGLSFSALSAPFEFIPLLVAARSKQRETHWVARCARELVFGATLGTPAVVAAAGNEEPGTWGPEPTRDS
jgi:predicted metal-dependent phosphoesterase TrpH